MAELRTTTEDLFALYTSSDASLQVSTESLFILYTETVAGHELRASTDNLLVLYTLPAEPELPTVECSFGSSFQPGVRRGQGVCE